MDEIAVLVAEDLNLNVLGLADVAFEKDLGASEGGAGLALCFSDAVGQLVGTECTLLPASSTPFFTASAKLTGDVPTTSTSL